MMQMNAGGHPLSIAAIKWTILQQGAREPTGVAIPARGTRAIPGVVEFLCVDICHQSALLPGAFFYYPTFDFQRAIKLLHVTLPT